LPVVKIEKKHCKKSGLKLEPPTCTVCTETINVDMMGMFMPCGHIYHPDCLIPWLEK
jgi:E3 ubiquitin-protein ligase RNF115/126